MVRAAAIVLAAGASRRLGQPKQLLVHEGETLVERAVRLAAEAGADPVLAVLGAHHESIRGVLHMTRAKLILNQKWEEGIASSIHAGIEALNQMAPAYGGALILPCDQPRLTAAHLRGLLDRFAAETEPVIVASTYAGVLGIPAVFPSAIFASLLALRGDKGARALLIDPPCRVIAVDFAGGEVDIDQPGDLSQLK
jgi:molybdenum cofactor cytidylyltransferase